MPKRRNLFMADFALILFALDNLVLNNYHRKMKTYIELGWDKDSIHSFISNRDNIYGKIASFNTSKVSFTASSRRNRYYEVYNRGDLLEYDVVYPNVIEAIEKLSGNFKTIIVSERTEDLRDKTIEILQKMNFPMDKITIYFKKTHDTMTNYKNKTILDIKSKYETGVSVIIKPTDAAMLLYNNYAPIGFSSIKLPEGFNGHTGVVCNEWTEIINALINQ